LAQLGSELKFQPIYIILNQKKIKFLTFTWIQFILDLPFIWIYNLAVKLFIPYQFPFRLWLSDENNCQYHKKFHFYFQLIWLINKITLINVFAFDSSRLIHNTLVIVFYTLKISITCVWIPVMISFLVDSQKEKKYWMINNYWMHFLLFYCSKISD
jgi:hypothetical protein